MNQLNLGWKLTMDKVELSIGLVNTILQYLSTKPFQEVAPLIDAIQKQAQAQQPTEQFQ